ncbi:MAG: exopolysaccharide biosynthesis polyprenyl glycosylphosphotransferase [Anaerolineales bacterium]|jgi:Undecaprenyl-phosphate galactose phosphotransferase WbaP
MDDLQIVSGKRWLENLFLLASDLVSFGVAIGLVAVARHYLLHVPYARVFDIPGIRTLLILLLICLVMLAVRGLYPGWKRSSVVELKEIVEAITQAYVITGIIIFIQGAGIDFSRSVFIFSWFFFVILLPVGRSLVRKFIARYPWWGEPVVVVGTKESVLEVAGRLAKCPRLGLRPAIGLTVDGSPAKNKINIPILPWSKSLMNKVQSAGIHTNILTIPSSDLRKDHPQIFRDLEISFQEIVFILYDDIYSFMMSQPLDIAGLPAIYSKRSLFNQAKLSVKRLIDILIVIIFSIPILVLGGLLALWVWIDSPGPIFYIQQRVGRAQKAFLLYKFRTMVQNANEVLAKMVEDPSVRKEWEHFHKLKADMRITRAGRWLRRMGLDELPQVINILRGEMSLVGPRPYKQDELSKIGDAAQTVFHVRPGITGWWQVNGRNELSFQERVSLELYYVSNWSLWLDFFIILKTPWVMFFLRDGN